MPFALDASIAICWAMQDESDPRAEAAAARALTDRPVVPAIWWYEVRNVLVLNEHRGRITPADSERFLESTGLLVRLVFPQDSMATLQLARKYELSLYDAAYLQLAKQESIPLATLDGDLTTAAQAEGVEIVA
jgi:predicted nucleic acid-binding protein